MARKHKKLKKKLKKYGKTAKRYYKAGRHVAYIGYQAWKKAGSKKTHKGTQKIMDNILNNL